MYSGPGMTFKRFRVRSKVNWESVRKVMRSRIFYFRLKSSKLPGFDKKVYSSSRVSRFGHQLHQIANVICSIVNSYPFHLIQIKPSQFLFHSAASMTIADEPSTRSQAGQTKRFTAKQPKCIYSAVNQEKFVSFRFNCGAFTAIDWTQSALRSASNSTEKKMANLCYRFARMRWTTTWTGTIQSKMFFYFSFDAMRRIHWCGSIYNTKNETKRNRTLISRRVNIEEFSLHSIGISNRWSEFETNIIFVFGA